MAAPSVPPASVSSSSIDDPIPGPTPVAKRSDLVTQGQQTLKKEFETTVAPQQTINEFRAAHELGSSEIVTALLEFTRLQREPRRAIYKRLLETLLRGLEAKIPAMSQETQDDLLRQSFPLINFSGGILRSIPLALLRRRTDIPKEYRHEFALNPDLSDTLIKMPLSVQRQIWESDAGRPMFEAKVGPLLDDYRSTLGLRHLSRGRATFHVGSIPSDRWRVQNKSLRGLVELIGPRSRLLDLVCASVVQRFAADCSDQCGIWASLMMDLLLGWIGGGQQLAPQNLDRRMRVARAVDTVLRSGSIDAHSIGEMHKALRAILPAVPAATPALPSGALPLGAPSELLKTNLEGAWAKLSECDASGLFAQPVSEVEAPNYLTVIKRPMDLSVIRTRMGAYSSLEAFSVDIELVASNCWKYNGKGSQLGEYATEWLTKWKQERAHIKLRLDKASRGASVSALRPAAKLGSGSLPALQGQDAERSLEVGCAVLILAHPGLVLLLEHSLAGALSAALEEKSLPSKQPLVPSAVQLLQINSGAQAMARTGRYRIPPPDAVTLRLHLPLVQRYMGEVGFSATLSAEHDFGDAAWPQIVDGPLRGVVLAALGNSFYMVSAGALGVGDPSRTVGLLRLLAAKGDMSANRGALDALAVAAENRKSSTRHKDVRNAILDFLCALVKQGGAFCYAHEIAIRILTSWGGAADSAAAAPGGASSSGGTQSAWPSKDEAKDEALNIVTRLATYHRDGASSENAAEVDSEPPAKRSRASGDSAADIWEDPRFRAAASQYTKLATVFPGENFRVLWG